MSVVGFIGLGNMGGPMAANLSKAGHEIKGFDVSAAAIEAAGKAGIACSASAVAVADGADAVITMLPSGQHVRDVYLGADGLIASARPGTLFIDSSTIDVKRPGRSAPPRRKPGWSSWTRRFPAASAGRQLAP